jgi:hypothetical protein
MEDELSNNSEMETATLSNEDILAQFEATLDMPEASDNSEQADEHVEEPDADENASETPSDEPVFEIDGEQLPLSEVRNRMMRQADYTRKTQELAEQRKVYQEAQFDKNQLRLEALQGIEALKQQMAIEFRQMEQPDWDYLVENDPAEFQRQQYVWQKREAAVRQMYEAEMALRTQAEAYEKEQHQLAIQESHQQFMQRFPEMRDPQKSAEALGEITQLLVDNGFTKEEIQGVSDWRIVGLLYELNKAMKAQKVIPEVVAKMEQKPVISQKQNSSKASDAYTRDFNKFNKTRSGNDAIALISRLL